MVEFPHTHGPRVAQLWLPECTTALGIPSHLGQSLSSYLSLFYLSPGVSLSVARSLFAAVGMNN